MNCQKGNIVALIAISAALIFVAIAGLFYYKNQLLQQGTNTVPTVQNPTPKTDETANWKTYTNAKYGYLIKYPKAEPIFGNIGYEQDATNADNVTIGFSNESPHLGIDVYPLSSISGNNLKDISTNNYNFNLKPAYKYIPSTIEAPKPIKFDSIDAYEFAIETNTYQAPDQRTGYGFFTGAYKTVMFFSPSLQSTPNDKLVVIHFIDVSPFNQIISTFKFLDQNSGSSSCQTDSDCQSGAKCMTVGPMVKDVPIVTRCVGPGEAVPL